MSLTRKWGRVDESSLTLRDFGTYVGVRLRKPAYAHEFDTHGRASTKDCCTARMSVRFRELAYASRFWHIRERTPSEVRTRGTIGMYTDARLRKFAHTGKRAILRLSTVPQI